MAFHHNFDPKDERAVFLFDVFSDCSTCELITTGIKISLIGFIGLLTLGIGGVGLMNIMLVSVTQRTTLNRRGEGPGRPSLHILFQFLAEAWSLPRWATTWAVAFAYLFSWSVPLPDWWSAFQEGADEGDIHLTIDAATLIGPPEFSVFVGIISGIAARHQSAS